MKIQHQLIDFLGSGIKCIGFKSQTDFSAWKVSKYSYITVRPKASWAGFVYRTHQQPYYCRQWLPNDYETSLARPV